jgi:hypothetical protein
MSRKGTLILLAALGLTLTVAGGVYSLVRQGQPQHPPLPVQTYLETPDGVEGYRFSLSGSIDRQLATGDSKRLIFVEPLDGGPKVPVLFSTDLPVELHPGQRYRITVQARSGILHAQDLRKL